MREFLGYRVVKNVLISKTNTAVKRLYTIQVESVDKIKLDGK